MTDMIKRSDKDEVESVKARSGLCTSRRTGCCFSQRFESGLQSGTIASLCEGNERLEGHCVCFTLWRLSFTVRDCDGVMVCWFVQCRRGCLCVVKSTTKTRKRENNSKHARSIHGELVNSPVLHTGSVGHVVCAEGAPV